MKEIKLSNRTVTMREPKVRDIRALKDLKTQEEKEMALICNLTGLTQDELDELSLKDYAKLSKALEDFYLKLERLS
ncbi:MAG TPA: phage tail assembly protein [Sulfurospirillum arcachonense]|nr:phage tail assembly protein [Sulfurospirillum arcachonense]